MLYLTQLTETSEFEPFIMRRMKIEVKLKNSEDISCISMEIFGCKYKGLRNCSMLLFSFLFYLKEEHILEEIH